MAIAADSSGSTLIATSVTTANADITAAAAGAWCYALLALGVSQAGAVTWTGWTQVLEGDEGTATHYALYRRQKIAGDTTFAVTWGTATRGDIGWASFAGADGTTPDELAAVTLHTAFTERVDVNDGANPWVPLEVADSNGTVTAAAHSYTATMTTTGASALESHGGAILLFIVPAAAAAGATPVPLVVPQAAVMQAANW